MKEEMRIVVKGFEIDDILGELNSSMNNKGIKFTKDTKQRIGAVVLPDPTIIVAGINLLAALIGLLHSILEKKGGGKIIIGGESFEYPFNEEDIVIRVTKSRAKKIILSKS